MSQNDKAEIPRERILNEAEALFAQKGYHGVSVREIITAADCNLAAVNYHFGNKQNLYLEVFRCRWLPRARRLREYFNKSLAAQDSLSLATVVQALAQTFLEGPLSDEERQRHHQLMSRELVKPTEAFELVAQEVMGPFFKELADLLRSLMTVELGEEQMMLNILSIFAMVIHFNFARVAVSRLTGREYDPAFKAQLVEHLIKFSLKGLGGINREAAAIEDQKVPPYIKNIRTG
jgi:AcrR family transcriptional regulator